MGIIIMPTIRCVTWNMLVGLALRHVTNSPPAPPLPQVGKRKRAVRWDELERLQRQTSSIPLERALVPIHVYESMR